MKIARNFALLLVALAALAVAAPSAYATNVTNGVDATGSFTATGVTRPSSGSLTPDTLASDIICTAVSFEFDDGNEDGIGIMTTDFDSCSASGISCTIGSVNSTSTIVGTGGVGATTDTYTIDNDNITSNISCGAFVNCTVVVTGTTATADGTGGANTFAGGTITDSTDTVTLAGRADSTSASCTGALDGGGTITATFTVEITA